MMSLSALQTKLLVVAVAGITLIGMAGTIVVQRSNLKAAQAEITTEKDKRRAAELALTDTIKRFSFQLSNIKALEVQRQQNQAATDPFYLRLDAVGTETKDENNVSSTLADRLNGLNADTNRLLTDSTK
jgi:hypothetical protein